MKKKLVFSFIVLLSLGIALPVLFVAAVSQNFFGELPSKQDLLSIKNETASLIYSQDGELIGKVFSENRTNAQFGDFPQGLVNALVATEDARFFEHEGVDSRSLVRVLIRTIIMQDRSGGGGSTITQQLVKNLYGRPSFGALTIPINKVKEAVVAYRLEDVYSKEDILTLYLNTVPFGENVFGIESASNRYFNKNTNELNIAESAVLIGSLKANSYYNPHLNPENAFVRRNVVLAQMEKYGYLSSELTDSLQQLPLELDYINLGKDGPADYFKVHVVKQVREILDSLNANSGSDYNLEKDGLIIKTTLNYRIQNHAKNSMAKHMLKMQDQLRKQYATGSSNKELKKMIRVKSTPSSLSDTVKQVETVNWNKNEIRSMNSFDSLAYDLTKLHAGMVAIDPKTGAILAWVGGMNQRYEPYDQVLAKRQLASTFKPILYAAALEQGLKPCDYINNDQLILEDYQNWTPQNYDHSEGGEYSLAGALAKSMNIPTVRVFFETGIENLRTLWDGLGFSSELPETPAVSLGTAESTVLELARAYGVFSTKGVLHQTHIISSIETVQGDVIYEYKEEAPEQPLSENASKAMNAMLLKAVREGTGIALNGRYKVLNRFAGKTGTSQDYSDAWFAAYNENISIACRVGASNPNIHFNNGSTGSGSALALPNVALFIKSMELDKDLQDLFTNQYDFVGMKIDCPDFVEEGKVEDFFERFKKKTTTSDKQKKKGKKKKRKRNKNG